jgi:proline iminopeptidase
MNPFLRWPLRLLGAFALLLLTASAVGWTVTRGDHRPPRTVVDDPSLPSATLNGVRLHVQTFGDPAAPTVVVVHGGPGNDFRYLLPLAALGDRFHVVFYDQRGSGLSERVPDERLTLEAFYGDLDAVIDRYGAGRPVRIVGHSWGAMLASGYVGLHPEKVTQLVLAEPGMLTSETAKRLMAETNGMMPKPSLEVAWLGARAFFRSLHVDGPDADARRDRFMLELMTTPFDGHPTAGYYCGRDLRTARLASWRFGARVAPALFAQAKGPDGAWSVDFVRGVDRFRGKVLFLVGGCDSVLGEAMQRRHRTFFHETELVSIPGAGHTMFGEKPEESLAAVRRYFAEERGSGS